MDITWKHREIACQIKQNWTHMKKYRMKISFRAILRGVDEEKCSRGNALEFHSLITLFIMFIIRQANDCLVRVLIFFLNVRNASGNLWWNFFAFEIFLKRFFLFLFTIFYLKKLLINNIKMCGTCLFHAQLKYILKVNFGACI